MTAIRIIPKIEIRRSIQVYYPSFDRICLNDDMQVNLYHTMIVRLTSILYCSYHLIIYLQFSMIQSSWLKTWKENECICILPRRLEAFVTMNRLSARNRLPTIIKKLLQRKLIGYNAQLYLETKVNNRSMLPETFKCKIIKLYFWFFFQQKV